MNTRQITPIEASSPQASDLLQSGPYKIRFSDPCKRFVIDGPGDFHPQFDVSMKWLAIDMKEAMNAAFLAGVCFGCKNPA